MLFEHEKHVFFITKKTPLTRRFESDECGDRKLLFVFLALELEFSILVSIVIAINYRLTSQIYCLQKYYVDTSLYYISYMSLYFKHK